MKPLNPSPPAPPNRPPAGPRAGRCAGLIALGLLALLWVGCGQPDAADGVARWHCPMHPTYTADRPGTCPICGMTLVPLAATPAAPADAAAPAGSPASPDRAAVTGNERGFRLAGVRTAPALHESLIRTTRTVGSVLPDERRIHHVHTKLAGWVEQLYINTMGQPVRAGQEILALYSPELLASQEEYLRARQAAARFAASSLPEVQRGAADLVTAARRRLELFDVPASFLRALEQTGQAQRAVTLLAPASGFVTSKQVVAGMAVEPGMELFTLTDLAAVWVEAEFYQHEARFLRVGQPAEVRLPFDPSRGFKGAVTFIYPLLSPDSRTLKVRLELNNPNLDLLPGMFVDVFAELARAEGVTVPEDAVIDTGLRQLVFVLSAPGTFTPRRVEVGLRGDGRALIVAGLAAGEVVATRANFLLDAESKLRAALAAALPATPGDGDVPAAPDHQH